MIVGGRTGSFQCTSCSDGAVFKETSDFITGQATMKKAQTKAVAVRHFFARWRIVFFTVISIIILGCGTAFAETNYSCMLLSQMIRHIRFTNMNSAFTIIVLSQ